MIEHSSLLKKFSGYKFQTVVYLFAPFNNFPKEVYYLHKNKIQEPTHDKLIGWGGNFCNDEGVLECSIREIKEELDVFFDENDLFLQGVIIRDDLKIKRIIYVLKGILPVRIDEKIIENEGLGVYKFVDYHRTHPQFFMKNDLFFLDTLFFLNDFFVTKTDNLGKIRHFIGDDIKKVI